MGAPVSVTRASLIAAITDSTGDTNPTIVLSGAYNGSLNTTTGAGPFIFTPVTMGSGYNYQYTNASGQTIANTVYFGSTYPASCKALYTAGQTTSGSYALNPASPTQAYCEMSLAGGGWTKMFAVDSAGTNFYFSSTRWTQSSPTALSTPTATTGDFQSSLYGTVAGTDILIVLTGSTTEYIGWTNLFAQRTFSNLFSAGLTDYSASNYNLSGSTLPYPWRASASFKGLIFSRSNWNTGGGCTYNMRITSGYGGNNTAGYDPKGWGRQTTTGGCGDANVGYPLSGIGENPLGRYEFYIR